MTPDIRPRPSPGSRIYSKEETPPPNREITQRVGRWTLNQGRVLNSHAFIILSPMHEPLLGFRTILREELSPLKLTTQQNGHQTPTTTFNNNQGVGLSLLTLFTQAVGEKLPVIHSHPQVDSLTTPIPQPLLGLSSKPQPSMNNAAKWKASRSPWQEMSLLPLHSSRTGTGRELQAFCCWGPKGFLPAFSY